MATVPGQTRCVKCEKERIAYKCEGCLDYFCLIHLAEHHQILGKELEEIENKRNLFQEILIQQKTNPEKRSLIEQIHQWKRQSIHQIEATAKEAEQLLFKPLHEHIGQTDIQLKNFTEKLQKIREDENFNEIVLSQLKEKLKELEEKLNKPSNISIKEDSSSFIKRISVVIYSPLLSIQNISTDARWTQNGITVAGGNGIGNALNQLSNPLGVYVDDDQTVYVADYSNHRIVEWKSGATTGQVVAGGNGPGDRNDQLNGPVNVIVDKQNDCLLICNYNNHRIVRWPRRNGTSGQTIISKIGCWGLAIDNNGYLYVSDVDKHEVRRYKIGETNGTVVAGDNGKGARLDQLNDPNFICIDQDHSVYVSDYGNHRVVKWVKGAKEGIVVAGGQDSGNGLTQLSGPYGVLVDQLGSVYVAEQGSHRVMRWLKGAREGSVVVGGNGDGRQANHFNAPVGLSLDQHNNLYIVDYNNHRVQKFNIELNA